MNEIKLSVKERLQLSFQLKILEGLYPDEATDYRNQRIAIENGYTYNYQDMFSIIQEEMPENKCREVLKVLNMYRGIIFSYNKLENNNSIKKIKKEQIRFPGFDGQDEAAQLLYAEYYLNDLNRFQEISSLSNNDYDSHEEMMPTYLKMLEKWEAINYSSRYTMNESEIMELLRFYVM